MSKYKLKIEKIISIIIPILYIFLLYFITYIMKYDNWLTSFMLIQMLIKNGGIQYLLVGYLIILSLFLIFKGIVRDSLKANIIVTLIVVTITMISYYKYKVLKEPFLPNDILLIGNINQIASFGISLPSIQFFISLMLIVMLLYLQYLLLKNKKENIINLKVDIITRVFCIIVGILLLYNICISSDRYINFNIKNDIGNNYSWMGGNATFFIRLGDLYFKEPDNYSENAIEKIKDTNYVNNEEINNENPNIILIMNEAFSDPTKIKNIEFSKDPMEDIRNIIINEKNSKMGDIISPVIGGGTSLPEFEVLTGLTSYFIPEQVFPYTSYITSDMNSIARTFRKNNYYTVGIHTYTKTFYKRYNVYKLLGFEKTIFSEDIENPEYKREFISDNEFANQVIEQLKNNEGKKFIFGVTMQNHMPYANKNYDYYDIDINTNILTKEEKNELKNYVQGIYDANKMYAKLVNYIKQIDEPTILIMFGDHFPTLYSNSIDVKSNYTNLQYNEIPYIIYANYDININDIPQYMSPSNLGINTLKLSNINIPWYLKKFEELYLEYPVVTNQIIINKDGKELDTVLDKHKVLLEQCEIIQYDLLIKKEYIEIDAY